MERAAHPTPDPLARAEPPLRSQTTPVPVHRGPLHYGLNPAHAILLGFPVTLFVAAVITDITYMRTAQIQWSNFSSWLIAAGLVAGGFVALWALIDFVRWRRVERRSSRTIYLLLIAVMWVVGFINALIHSGDAWHSVTTGGLIFSIITALLALVAAWIAYSSYGEREA